MDREALSRPRHTKLPVLLLVACGLALYSNGLSGPFTYDDLPAITYNPHIRSLWPIWEAMIAPPATAGNGRPLIGITLALNYALGGLDVWGYHVFNVAAHLFAVLTLYGVIRRTLLIMQRERRSAMSVALSAALLWLVHPLCTDAVNMVASRNEVLVGLFYLLTLYCFIRGIQASNDRNWFALGILSCAAGMGCKAVMVSAPLIILIYDYMFITNSIRRSLACRWRLYLGLAATWGVLLASMSTGMQLSTLASMGDRFPHTTPLLYLLTQANIIVHYLALSMWPDCLVVDYFDWPLVDSISRAAPALAIIAALVAGTIWSLARKFWPGFLGVAFLAILAPSSSFIPNYPEIAAEHRMYLPVVCVIVFVVVCVGSLSKYAVARIFGSWGRHAGAFTAGVVFLAVFVLGSLTRQRNEVFASMEMLWGATVAQRPRNTRAHNNLGIALAEQGRFEEAIYHYHVALELRSDNHRAHNNLGNALVQSGRAKEALPHFRRALEIKPAFVQAHHNLGIALCRCENVRRAIPHFAETLRLAPGHVDAHNNLGLAYLGEGWGKAAISHYLEALEINPNHPQANLNLADALFQAGDFEQACEFYRRILKLNPAMPRARLNYGIALMRLGMPRRAVEEFNSAVELEPDSPIALANLGIALLEQGDPAAAIEYLESSINLRTDSATAHFQLGRAFDELDDRERAVAHFREAVEIQPDFDQARECLDSSLLLLRAESSLCY